MHILKATIVKDLKILRRDRVGLVMMFFMPILLVMVITSVQNSTFELVNNNKISLVICNQDRGPLGKTLTEGIRQIGLFNMQEADSIKTENNISTEMHNRDALVLLVIPPGFSRFIQNRASDIASRALSDPDSVQSTRQTPFPVQDSLKMYYHPVMQPAFRQSIQGALESAVQVIQGEAIVKKLYQAVNQKEVPAELEKQILLSEQPMAEIPVSRSGTRFVPNASQHNVPAWTIFAMFFIVTSLGGAYSPGKKQW